MTSEHDVAARASAEVPFLGGIARLTLVPADQSPLKTSSLHLEVQMEHQEPRPAIDVPASMVGELFAAALRVAAAATELTAAPEEPTLRHSPVESELDKAVPYFPQNFMLQPSLADKAVYWAQLGPHRVMRMTFVGLLAGLDAPILPVSLRHVSLRLEPGEVGRGRHPQLRRFTFFDPDAASGDQHSFYAESLQVEFTGLT